MPNLLDMVKQGNNNGSLSNLMQLIQLVNQQNQGAAPTEKIGGYDIPINRGKQSPFNTGLNALSGLTQGFTGMQQGNKRNQFMQSVQQIAQEQSNPDEKINKLVGLMAQHGSDYGLGLKDIITQYGQQANRNALTQVYGYDEQGNLVPKGAVPKSAKVVAPNVAQQKFNLAKEEKTKQQDTESEFIRNSAEETLGTIAEVEKGLKYFGAVGEVPTLNPWGFERKNWEANINKLLSGKIVALITDMKKASKTGATGFGQLSEKEGQILREASTALKRNLSPQDAQKYINIIKKSVQKIMQRNSEGNISAEGTNQNSDYQKYLQSIGGK